MKDKELAFAKLTLTLRMLDKREDGFNNLEAFTVFLPDVFDTIATNDKNTFEIESNDLGMVVDDSNLVVRAQALVENALGAKGISCEHAFGLTLDKVIPIAAGLGGGSADAGAVLRLYNGIYSGLLDSDEINSIATQLGSDVPACVSSRALWMRGRGELIEPVKNFSTDIHVLIVTPTIFCPTPLVYKRYEEMGRPSDEGISQDYFSQYFDTFHNDLALAAFDLFENLGEFKAVVEKLVGLKFGLAGSGSTLFTVAGKEDIKIAKEIIDREIPSQDIRIIATSSMV